MAIEPVKVPQNVYIEERIIGPITLRQIIIVMVSGGLSYAIWSSFRAAGAVDLFTTILSWIPCLIGVAFAFIKINGITLFHMCLLTAERMEKPAQRAWAPRQGITINIRTPKKEAREAPIDPNANAAYQKRIQELSSVLDAGPKDPPEESPALEELQLDTESFAAPVEEKTLPVQEDRVQTSPLEQSIDGIESSPSKKLDSSSSNSTNIFTDITPPPSQ